MRKIIAWFVANSLKRKLDLREDTVETVDKKKWWTSKTILSAIVVVLIGLYEGIDTQIGPAMGFDLPAIPGWILSILGAVGVYGRFSADKKIA